MKSNMIKVSVTIAAYNCAEYIISALDCVINQTMKDIEILIVDDASTDDTPKILKNLACKDSRVKIITNEENQGLAVARNKCLNLAKGKYILFLDADDLFSEKLCEKAYQKAEVEQADCVIWDYVVFDCESHIPSRRLKPSALSSENYCPKNLVINIPAFTWIKLFKTDELKKLGVAFPAHLTYQDVPVHWMLMTSLNKISFLPERLSYYRQQPGATTHKKGWSRADYFIVMDLVKNYLDDNSLYETLKVPFLQRKLESMAGVFDVVEKSLKGRALSEIKSRMGDDELIYLNSGNPLRLRARLLYQKINGSASASFKLEVLNFVRYLYRFIN